METEASVEQRVPCHLEAERGVLGAILLDFEAFGRVVQILSPPDFYSTAHQHIYAAMMDLFDQNQPIDPVLLKSALEKAGDLDKVGGIEYLLSLAEAVPSSASVDYYANLVKEKAVMRSVIAAGEDMVRAAQVAGTGFRDVLDEVERKVMGLGQSLISGDIRRMDKLLSDAFDRLEQMQGRQGRITGLSTGFDELDDLINGLQPSQLIVVAGRPSMGKTTFSLNIAEHVGVEQEVPVVVFSLEMSSENLVENMLCSRAQVNAHKLKRGMLGERMWARLGEVAGDLGNAPIYIDSTPGMNALEIRAKARRLKASQNLGLVIVDYLQLLEMGGFRSRVENRQQEIATISRGMKSLARELDIPVIAISQLNRSVEQRHKEDFRPRMSDLRECVVGDTPVTLREGRRVPIRELVGTTPHVVTLDHRGRLVGARSDKVWRVGRRPVFAVQLASGRRVVGTGRHRLKSFGGWRRVSELDVGDRIALARSLPDANEPVSWPDEHVALLGQMVGDGSYLVGAPMRYTSASEENLSVVETAAASFGCRTRRYRGRGAWAQLVIRGNGNRWKPAGVNRWLRDLGIFGQRSPEKRIPRDAFRLPRRQVALLLRHLWATDGCLWTRKNGRGGHAVYFATASRGLADDVAALLLRLGLVARIREPTSGGGWHVVVSGAPAQREFLDHVGGFGPREHQATFLASALQGVESNSNVDTVPREVFEHVRTAMRDRGISQREMARIRGTAYGGTSHFRFAPSRGVVLDYAERLDDRELRQVASSDVFWDRVTAIEPAGTQEVFDLTVPGPACWVDGHGVVNHNSGAIEQDADVILFLYRDEYYHRDREESKGLAEVIVAKQRNGPTGHVDLNFTGEYMRFRNLAKSMDSF